MNNTPICPLCDKPLDQQKGPDQYWDISYKCRRCGIFKVHTDTPLEPDKKYLLSAVCRMRSGSSVPTIRSGNVESLVSQLPRLTVAEKLDQLLELIGRNTPKIGAASTFDVANDYPLLTARDTDEALYLVAALCERGLLNGKHFEIGHVLVLTIPGWERIEQLRQSGHTSSLVFVAMWFHESTSTLYADAIAPAIRDAGYEPLRIDQHEHVNRIDDEIVGQIKKIALYGR